jgi:hypothetical protein
VFKDRKLRKAKDVVDLEKTVEVVYGGNNLIDSENINPN